MTSVLFLVPTLFLVRIEEDACLCDSSIQNVLTLAAAEAAGAPAATDIPPPPASGVVETKNRRRLTTSSAIGTIRSQAAPVPHVLAHTFTQSKPDNNREEKKNE